jgi:FkbM family methyltransferase
VTFACSTSDALLAVPLNDGTYVRDVMADGFRNAVRDFVSVPSLTRQVGGLQGGLAALTRQVGELKDETAALTRQVGELEGELAALKGQFAFAVIRDVAIINYMGFPIYFYRDSLGRPGDTGGLSIEEAENMVDAREKSRRKMLPAEYIDSYWSTFSPHNYNEFHKPLLACLEETYPGIKFIDVGGNVGDTAIEIADFLIQIGSQSTVTSFEPGRIHELARASISLNRLSSRVEVCNVAAGASDGFLAFRTLLNHPESSSMAGIERHYIKAIPLGETRIVKTAQLDTVVGDKQPIYLKIDAEGADFAVLRGAFNLIRAGLVPVIHIELTGKYQSEQDWQDMSLLLERYDLYNSRALDVEGRFDRLDNVQLDRLPEFKGAIDRCPHGWTDAVLIDKKVASQIPFRRLLSAYNSKFGNTATFI